jgi:hypothetical protein
VSLFDGLDAAAKLGAAFRYDFKQEGVAVYAEKLKDIPAPLLVQAVDRLIETSTFLPSIAEIRRCAAGLAGLLPPGPGEVLALVRRADVRRPVYRRDGSLAYVEREWDWPEDADPDAIELARDTLAKVGEPAGNDDEAFFGWDTAFTKTYEKVAAEFERDVLADLSKALPAHESKELDAHPSPREDA